MIIALINKETERLTHIWLMQSWKQNYVIMNRCKTYTLTVKTAEGINKKERRINKHFQLKNYKYDQLQEDALND